MNMNTSLQGIGKSEQAVPAVKPAGSTKLEADHSTEILTTITNVNELKNAELRGEDITVSDEQLVRAIDRAIKAMQGKSTNLKFSVHDETKLISVKVIDSQSGEVLREIPPEKTLDFVAKLWEMAGILIDEKR